MSILTHGVPSSTQAMNCHCGGSMNAYVETVNGAKVNRLRCNLCGANREDQGMKTRPYPETKPYKRPVPLQEAGKPAPEPKLETETKLPETEPEKALEAPEKPPEPAVKMTSKRGAKTEPRSLNAE